MGNAVQNLVTLHYTRRLYNGRFVPNRSLPKASPTYNPEDSVHKLLPVAPGPGSTGKKDDDAKARDQLTPLAARLFGTWTFIAGAVRLYAAYRVSDPVLYQLSLLTHVMAASHYTSEFLVFKTVNLGWEHLFPLGAGFGGAIWMALQYQNYVSN